MRGYNPTILKNAKSLGTTLGLLVLGATSFTTSNVLAQTAILEEITVTAQRREENIKDVPISVTAMSGDDAHVLFEGGEDIRALANRIPSLYAESSNGRLAPRFYMRGLGNTDFDLAASQSVSVIVDEVVQENVILKSFPLFDIDRIEVLRGPQGTLFGRNTPAGIVKFDTRKPTAEFGGYGILTAGSAGTINVEAALGGSLNNAETLMARVSLLSQNRDDWIRNDFNDEDDALGGFNELAWRAQLLWDASDSFSALLSLHGRKLDNGTASIFRANIVTTGSNELNENFIRDTVFFDGGDDNPQEADGTGGLLNLNWEFANDMTLTSITAYETVNNKSLGDIDGGNPTGPGFIPFQSDTEDGIDDLDQITQEFRLASQASDRLFWQAGVFYFDSEFTVTTNPFFAPPTTLTHTNTAWAVFGQVSYDFTDRLTVIGGLRYTDDEKAMKVDQANFPIIPDTVEVDDSQVSWDLSANFVLSDATNLYARVATGFRAPTIQGRDIAFFAPPSTADSETITSIEFGIKGNYLEDHLRLNAAIYAFEISDPQFTAIGGSANATVLINADKGNGSGFDLDAELLITDNLFVGMGLSYNKTEIDDPDLRIQPCGSGQCSVIDQIDVNGNAIVDGNPFPQAPETMLNFVLRYTKPIDTGTLFFVTDWARQGETTYFLYDAKEYRTSGTYEGGLRLGYEHGDGQWEIAVFGRNITDEENLKGGIDFNNNTGFVNDRQIWGGTFKINF
jgi:iron complex outermembrane receptor protein